MTRIKLLTAIAATALIATATTASAASTATVTVTGTVTSKCSTGPYTDNKGLGELADAAGHLDTAFSNLTAATTAIVSSFSLTCTGANAGVSVQANALGNTAFATAPSGYTRAVDFTGRAEFDLVAIGGGSSTLPVDDTSVSAGATSGAWGASNFLANSGSNVRVSAYGFTTASGAILVAGQYTGSIVVTITPSATPL